MTRHLLTSTRLTRLPIALILLFAFTASAQPPDTLISFTWDYTDAYEAATCIRSSPYGGYIVTGYTLYDELSVQTWTAKLDQDGSEIWVLIEGCEDTDAGYFIEPTRDGGFIQCGETLSYAPNAHYDAFIRKLDSAGNTEWVRVLGDPDHHDYFYCVREVPTGGYIAEGYCDGANLVRFNQSGGIVWQWTHPDIDFAPKWVEPTGDGGFIVPSDRFNQNAGTRVFTLYKVSPGGSTIWVNDDADPGIPREGVGYCVREDVDHSLYACGAVRRDSTYYDFYVTKRDPEGDVLWSLYLDNPDTDITDFDKAYGLTVLVDGNIAVTGYSNDVDGHLHLWIAKLSSQTGDLLWLHDQPGGDYNSLDQGRDGCIVASYNPRSSIGVLPDNISFLKFEPEIEVNLAVWTPVIPESGGWLRYGAHVSNILIDPTPLDAWIVVTGPNGERVPLNSFPVTLQPGATFTRPQMTVWIPAAVPNGDYTLEAHLGVAPPDDPPGGPGGSRNMGLGSFTFTKGGSR